MSCISMLAGIAIYVLLRPTEALAITLILDYFPIITIWRENLVSYNYPSWVLYNLPDFLWAYSYSLFIISMWGFDRKLENIVWLSTIPLLTLGHEISQYFNLLPGTFDILDIIFTIGAILASIITIKIIKTIKSKGECLEVE